MASLSSTNSVSSANSLGNTSLRGFGGMVSGIDRDEIIGAMTLHAQNRVTAQQAEITKLEWKQEAYQSITDQILGLADDYLSYSSSKCLIDPSFFAKNIITVHGKDESTCYVKATGTSEMADNVSITSVRQLARSSVRESQAFGIGGSLQTTLTDLDEKWISSALEGTQLVFGTYNATDGKVTSDATFTFKSTYQYYNKETGKTETRTIDYTNAEDKDWDVFYKDLAKQLNEALESQELNVVDKPLSDAIEFQATENGITIVQKNGGDANGIVINKSSTALKALGYVNGYDPDDENSEDYEANGISLTEFKDHQTGGDYNSTAFNAPTALQYMTGKKLTFNYDGSSKEIELITKDEAAALADMKDADGNPDKAEQMKAMVANLQIRLDQAYGKGAVTVDIGANGLSFSTKDDSSVTITSGDTDLLNNLGIAYGESNKVNLSGKLTQSALRDKLGDLGDYTTDDGSLDLEINGVKITGLTANSTVQDILSKINSSDAGVKATYSQATGKFMLVSSETGAGRQINLDSKLAQDLFGQKDASGDYAEKIGFTDGQNAIFTVSYGNGEVQLERSSNTFDLEGLSVTVSGVFGGAYTDAAPLEGNFDIDGKTNERIFYTDAAGTTVAVDPDKNGVYYDKDGKMVNYKGYRIEGDETNGYNLVTSSEWKSDPSAAVTFSAAADAEGATERVKSFIEDFNKLIKEINTQVTTYPDSSYGVLTDAQKAEMSESEIEKWETKAKEGILYGDATMRSLSMDVQSILTTLMSSGVSYADLEKIGITYSDDYLDGGTLVFNESAFKSAMESDPELVSNIITGGGDVSKGLATIVDEAFTPYATRYASKNSDGTSKGTYGMLIEIAGTSKKPTTLCSNQIFTQLKTMNETLEALKLQLKTQQERYISQFTYMESMINQLNSQSNYLSQITG